MRAAVSLMLATALVTTPLKLVLAQAAQQDAATVQQTTAQESSGHRLIGIPPVTDNTSWLWEPLAGKDATADIFAEDGLIPGPAAAPISKDAKTAMIVVAVLAAVVIGLVLIVNAIGDEFGKLGAS